MAYFIKCWIGAFLLLVLTYNPTGRSYIHWVEFNPFLPASIILLVGFLLCLGYAFFIRETLKNVGGRGVLLIATFLAVLIWTLSDYGWIDLYRPFFLDWLLLCLGALTLAVGPSWKRVM